MKKIILISIIFFMTITSFSQKKNSKAKYLTYDEYTKICDNLSSENYNLKNNQRTKAQANWCFHFDKFVKQFDFFVNDSKKDSFHAEYDYDYKKTISRSEKLYLMENDSTDYSAKFPKAVINNFVVNKVYPNKENFKIMKKYINSFSTKQLDSINSCKVMFEKEWDLLEKKILANEAKIDKLLHIRDNFSGTWNWLTLSNGRRVWARLSNGYYYY